MDNDERLTLAVEPFGACVDGRWSRVGCRRRDGRLPCESSWPPGEHLRIVPWASPNGFEFVDGTTVALVERVVSTCLVTGDGTVADAVSSFPAGMQALCGAVADGCLTTLSLALLAAVFASLCRHGLHIGCDPGVCCSVDRLERLTRLEQVSTDILRRVDDSAYEGVYLLCVQQLLS